MSNVETIIHLCAGGMGGTMGAIVTCPLEVVKTRLQASTPVYRQHIHFTSNLRPTSVFSSDMHWNLFVHQQCPLNSRIVIFQESVLPWTHRVGMLSCLRNVIEHEGPRALFKGLAANLVGVAPTRAIYFCTYSTAKRKFNQVFTPNSHLVHIFAAASAGFVSSTLTNPIWFVKTRMQLDRSSKLSAWRCVSSIYHEKGVLGFYKGISASYFGISETIVNFVLYEFLKSDLRRLRQNRLDAADPQNAGVQRAENEAIDFMIAGAISKTVACCLAYPHEVARTRLREENTRYHGFFQTLTTVFREEGYRGLYRGLGTQLVRQIPNMAVMMTTYEAVSKLLKHYCIVDVPEGILLVNSEATESQRDGSNQ